MRFNKLDLNLLVALDHMLSHQNVSRAAEKMNVTQSTMSNALARLRDYFEDDLLVPVGRKMVLTPRAEHLQKPVRDILIRIESSITSSPAFDPLMTDKTFVIYSSDYSLSTLVPHFCKDASPKNYPIKIDFRPQTSDPQSTLEKKTGDIIIIPQVFASPNHPYDVLYDEEFVCIADAHHPMNDDGFDIESYCSQRHAVMQPSTESMAYETMWMEKMGIKRDIHITTFSFMTLPYLVTGTEYIATVHKSLALQAIRHLPLKILKLPVEIPPMRQVMQWHTYRTDDPAIKWIRDELMKAAQQLAT